MNQITEILYEIWTVWCQMAPYLILGFGVAGTLSVFIKPDFVQKHLGKGTLLPVLKATILGVPLPLCSCGVIPVAASLRKQGASKGATSAFLLSTPQTGVDSIAVTYSLMGLFFAVFRPLAAFVSGIIGGVIISLTDKSNTEPVDNIEIPEACCDDTCETTPSVTSKSDGFITRVGNALHYGFIVLPRDIGRALLLGVVIAGIIGALMPPGFFAELPGGQWAQLIFMLIVGIPIYVCATSSVPVAAALILKGLSPGAALVFLIAGPATNAAAVSTIWKIMGRHTAIVYLSVVAVLALLSGVMADFMITQAPGLNTIEMHHHGIRLWEVMSGVCLGIIILWSYLSAGKKNTAKSKPEREIDMNLSLIVKGMKCGQCEQAIDTNIRKINGVDSVSIDLPSGKVQIFGSNFSHSLVKKTITDLGFVIC